MTNFKSFGLPEALQASLDKVNFTTPTPIQAKAIPFAMQGRDILASAQTGTGKTGAFAIPTIAKLLANPEATAIILTPTRELATQVFATIKPLLGNDIRSIRTALLIGGEFIGKQLSQLRSNPRLIIGTPGRVNDHLQRKSLNLSKVAVFILDETDRMLDLGFGIQIKHIANSLPAERQTLLFSATMPNNIMSLSKAYLKNPEVIAIEPEKVTVSNIKQTFLKVSESEKFDQLCTELDTRTGSVIVFVKTKMNSEKVAKRLSQSGHIVDVIHGDLRQSRRDRVIKNFRSQEFRVLIATDVAARGLDIPHIEHVINHDLPQCPEDYVHRIGRTGRNGATGEAISFVSPSESGKMRDIDRMLNPGAPRSNDRDHSERKGGSRHGGGRSGGRSSGGYGRNERHQADAGPFGGFKSRDDNRGEGRGNFGGERREGRSFEGRSENRGPRPEGRGYEGRRDNREGRPYENRGPRPEGRNFDDRKPRNDFRNSEDRGNRTRAPRNDDFGNTESASQHQYKDENIGNSVDNFADRKGFNHNNRPRNGAGGGFKGPRPEGQRREGRPFENRGPRPEGRSENRGPRPDGQRREGGNREGGRSEGGKRFGTDNRSAGNSNAGRPAKPRTFFRSN